MGDKYTVYPEALKKKIQGVNKYYEDRKKEEERWNALTPEQQEAEIKEAERLATEGNPPANPPVANPDNPPPPDNPDNPPPEETVESLREKLSKSEAALSTLRGKYDKEPAEMQRQINFLTDQLASLQKELLAAKTVVDRPKPQKLSEILKDDIESLKQEMAPEIVERIVNLEEKILDLARQEAKQAISEVAVTFDGKLALSARERFDKELIDAYPDWEKMWRTPEFQAFLDEEDGLSGQKKYSSIEDAFKRLNSKVVLKAFDLFTGKKAETVPPVKEPSNGDPDKLKRRVSAPRTSSPGGQIPINQPEKMSPQEAKQALVTLSSAYSRGQYKGTKDQYDKEYAKLHAIATAKGT